MRIRIPKVGVQIPGGVTSGVTIGWTGWTMSRGPRVPGAPEFQTKKNISLATQSKFDLIHYSYSVSTPVDVDLSLKVK